MTEALERRAVPRTAAAFRALWAVGAAVTIVGWSLAGPVPVLPLVLASAAALWAALVVLILKERGRLPAWVAFADAGLFTGLVMAAGWLVPASLVGDGTTWIMTGASVSALMAGWLLPPWQGLSVTSILVTAYLVGLHLADRVVGSNQIITAIVIGAQGGLAVAILAIIRKAADRADVAVSRRISTEQASALERQREQAREEQDRMLHDQVGTSLWMLGRGLLRPDDARVRARETVTKLRELAAGRAAPAQSGTLAQQISTIVEDVNRAGLVVELTTEPIVGRRQRWRPLRRSREPQAGWLPSVVIDAAGAAVREALANVLAYAGSTPKATVSVRFGPSHLTITVSDQGTGFELANIDHDRHGVRDSIVARMAEVGGSATLNSVTVAESPNGHRTTWILAWEGAEVVEHGPARLTRTALTEYGRGFMRIFAVIAAVFHLLGLVAMLTTPGDYRSPALAMACWVIMAATAVVLYVGIGRAWISASRARVAGLVIVVAGVVSAVDCKPGAALGFANWALGDAGWFLAILAAYLPVSEAAAWLVTAAIANAAIVVAVDRPGSDGLLKLVSILVGVGTTQVGAAIAFGLLHRAATATATNLWAASELVAAGIAEAEARDRRAQVFRGIDAGVVNVLAGIADGLLDPHDQDVRQRCLQGRDIMRQYAMLRRAGAADLAPLAAAAARAGVRVRFPILHRLERVQPHRRHEMVALLVAALASARPGDAVVTVQDNTNLATPSESVHDGHRAAPLSVTLRFNLAAGDGPKLRESISSHRRVNGLHIDLDLSDDEGNAGDENATLAWLAVVYRP